MLGLGGLCSARLLAPRADDPRASDHQVERRYFQRQAPVLRALHEV